MLMTIGHSTHRPETFISLLHAHRVTGLADVRAVPRSRRHPHFSQVALASLLSAKGIVYSHFPGLGGHRVPHAHSRNGGWRDAAFRGYADYMQTGDFLHELGSLLVFAEKYLVAIMCAESQWWRCHRQLIADSVVARGVEVRHIVSGLEAELHELTAFARVSGISVHYPALV